ncbi:hypothetical protein Syun_007009 [Stephania yunnanensis]|uniref:Uncharacterized protein n=1 Tax=Stephania yunnanensis TaxID=152371 RepID=A0AAP0KZ56_9MAGN
MLTLLCRSIKLQKTINFENVVRFELFFSFRLFFLHLHATKYKRHFGPRVVPCPFVDHHNIAHISIWVSRSID